MQKQLLITLTLLLSAFFGFSQTKEIYENPNFAVLSAHHRKVAIVPFKVTISVKKLPKDMTPEMLKGQEAKDSKAIQSALHTYLLKHEVSDDYSVTFQDVSETNALLRKKSIDDTNIDSFTSRELCEVLGVDAVISGFFNSDQPMSNAAALGMIFLVGFSGGTNSGKASISLNDGKTGDLLWKYDKKLSRGLGSDSNDIINAIMRKASRKFPYARR